MRVEQIHELLNTTVQEVTGEEELLEKDLSNIVDVGTKILDTDNVDNYVNKLVNRIGKTVFVNKLYQGNVPSVLMDSWEFGSILQKVNAELPDSSENESWKLTDGEEYKTDIFYQPKVSAKFFNSKVTFEINMSFTELQVKESFTSASEMNGFLSMLTNSVQNAMTVRVNSLIMDTMNNMIAETLISDKKKTSLSGTGIKAVNLAEGFENDKGLTLENALKSPEFVKHATYTIKKYASRLTNISTLFNIEGNKRFTPYSDLKTVMLSDFTTASDIFLKSDLQNQELVSIGDFETIPFWQGSGKDYSINSTSSINVKSTSEGKVIDHEGIIGVMFDKNALGVSNQDSRVTTNYNPKAEFYTNYYKYDAGYFNDLGENFIVFYIYFEPEPEPEE